MALVGATAATARGECARIRYATGQNYIAPHGPRGLATISVRPGDVTLDNLLCMAQGLHATYPEWRDVIVLFFASRDAAAGWTPGWEMVDYAGTMPPFRKWEKEMRAGYFLDVEKGEEYLLLTPFGWNAGSEDMTTRIDLPARETRHCTVELGGRCLMAWEQFDYPSEVLTGTPSGSVIIEGRVARDGTVASVRATDGGAFPGAAAKALANAALKQVRSWRFEPSTHEERFRITYWYTSDTSTVPGGTRIDVDFPERVRISGNPIPPR